MEILHLRKQSIDANDGDQDNCSDNDKHPNYPKVPKLIDDKCKHLEKTLSAAKRDQMLLNEAKEDVKFRKDLAEATSRSIESFTNALEGISSTMAQLGKGICQSVEMLSRAMLAQQQQQFQPGNHNVFYQNPNMYPPMGNTQGAFLPNDETSWNATKPHKFNSPSGKSLPKFNWTT